MPPTLPPYRNHLSSATDLQTTYEAKRAGFVSLALEKTRQAVPFLAQARTFRTLASRARTPNDLMGMLDIERPLLTAAGLSEEEQEYLQTIEQQRAGGGLVIERSILSAAGVSEKALGYLQSADKQEAIRNLIRTYLEPAGANFIEELVYRFLLTKGDALGGMMRNIGGELGQRLLNRTIISSLDLLGWNYSWLSSQSKTWIPKASNNADIELYMNGVSWIRGTNNRTLVFNRKVKLVKKNIDLCLLNCRHADVDENMKIPQSYLALGELKGGIDPAGADEHWKTASKALTRIREAFAAQQAHPQTVFIAAAIEDNMATEIWDELVSGQLSNAANSTKEAQLISLCNWLINL